MAETPKKKLEEAVERFAKLAEAVKKAAEEARKK